MRNIANIKPSAILVSLIQSAKLSNTVSRIALRDANIQWRAHISKPSQLRDQQTMLDVAAQLRLIIRQVSQKQCGIKRMSWSTLVYLEADLRSAYAQNINLEPLLDIVAANSEHSEVA
ncbi:hypothetical protein Psyc_0475 [Psychrobacter arcticus 273-4]|uniref:Uncharacterized protein n=1 Tax=Psychrobacter arcticus (strain DSM 17307 / VKM B-2377 / 273-4) TaxID=259536 RepID=Q4FUH0_PSYA2|nr:hypothetical protein [Psychrobacter arcticus]AAZ18338.1 hypothetical protein Psyc_0475 [Psychrobacter arcticus 273-4]